MTFEMAFNQLEAVHHVIFKDLSQHEKAAG